MRATNSPWREPSTNRTEKKPAAKPGRLAFQDRKGSHRKVRLQRKLWRLSAAALLIVSSAALVPTEAVAQSDCRTLDPPDFMIVSSSSAKLTWAIPWPTFFGMCGVATMMSNASTCSTKYAIAFQAIGVWTTSSPIMASCQWQCVRAGALGNCTLRIDQDGLPVELMEFSVEGEEAEESGAREEAPESDEAAGEEPRQTRQVEPGGLGRAADTAEAPR